MLENRLLLAFKGTTFRRAQWINHQSLKRRLSPEQCQVEPLAYWSSNKQRATLPWSRRVILFINKNGDCLFPLQGNVQCTKTCVENQCQDFASWINFLQMSILNTVGTRCGVGHRAQLRSHFKLGHGVLEVTGGFIIMTIRNIGFQGFRQQRGIALLLRKDVVKIGLRV